MIHRRILHTLAEFVRELKDRKFRAFHKRLQKQVIFDPKRLDSIKDFQFSKEQKQAIDEFYLTNYGKRIDYTCHRTYTAYSGKFSPAFMTEEIYIPELDHFLNLYNTYNSTFEDKNVMPLIAKSIGIKTPEMIYSCIKGFFLDSNNEPTTLENIISSLENYGRLFIKSSVESMGGRGCRLVDIHNGIDQRTGLPLKEILTQMREDFVIQKCVICHTSLKKIYNKSVNTFRVITYRWKDKIFVGPSVLRLGKGGMEVDNATQGGIFVGIRPNGELYDYAISKYGVRYNEHPDSGVEFRSYKINLFPQVIDAALRLHYVLPQIGVSNWDFTIDENGDVVLIEGNLQFGGIRLAQMATGEPAFGEHTAEMLQWIRLMKKISPSERKNHAFGN